MSTRQSESRITGNVVRRASSRYELGTRSTLAHPLLVSNATFDLAEQRWEALQPGLFLRAAKFGEKSYDHELCRTLRKLD